MTPEELRQEQAVLAHCGNCRKEIAQYAETISLHIVINEKKYHLTSDGEMIETESGKSTFIWLPIMAARRKATVQEIEDYFIAVLKNRKK